MKNTINKKNVKGYTLLEMLVTLVVFAILMTMIVQVLLISIESGRKISGRSKVRGDLSEVAVMMRRDFRNAGKIDSTKCGDAIYHFDTSGIPVFSGLPACFFSLSGSNYAWVYGDDSVCPKDKICKLKQSTSSGEYELYYQSSDILQFDRTKTSFEVNITQENESISQGIVLVSLTVNALESMKLDVATQYRQVTVFTRNF